MFIISFFFFFLLFGSNAFVFNYSHMQKRGIKLPGWYNGDLAQTILSLFPRCQFGPNKALPY